MKGHRDVGEMDLPVFDICCFYPERCQVLATQETERPPPTRAIRRAELRKLVPLSHTTIYELEQRGEFPRRFYLTPRCVVWDFNEVQHWLSQRRAMRVEPPHPDVRKRRRHPVRPL